jgi:uncharacterized protein (TIGR02680 family)
VLNLYRYDYEEFHFLDGRLLLRGNNGSGKSRILALQLPFLLDGEVSPARVEPDGDPAKRIEWNLLMGRYPDRTGYTWIEFGRRDAEGVLHFLTLGCGLRAVAGHTGLQSRWFFITPQRIGRDLFLQSAQHTPLSREKLAAAVGSAGRVFQKTEEYRRAVDEALFGLGARFGPLVELLLRLRRPQLSRKLDEEELSLALSDALPTLPASIIDEVAEAFSSLQTERGTLREFAAARTAVTAFLEEYSAYVRIAVRRRAQAVRTTHAAYEAAQRALRDAEKRFAAANAAIAALEKASAELETQLAGAESIERTLRESPEMKTAEEVRQAGDLANAAAAALKTEDEDHQRAADTAQRSRATLAQAEAQSREVEEALDRQLRTTRAAARAADLGEPHDRELPGELGADRTILVPPSAEPALHRILLQRERALVALRASEQRVATAQSAWEAAEAAQRRANEAADRAREHERTANERLVHATAALLEAYTRWRSAAVELQPLPPDALSEPLSTWAERRDGPSPLRAAIEDVHRLALTRLAERGARLTQARQKLDLEVSELEAAIARLEHGHTTTPTPPPLRRADRSGRPGAPLWRLCDFRAELPPAARAGLEAALEASGLLDAWVLPDGRLLAEADDTFIVAETGPASALPRHLGDALDVAIDAAEPATREFDAEVVRRLFSRIGLGAGAGRHWVALDGRWQLGPLSGKASKPAADYVGESTRAEHRRRQLAELRVRRQEAANALAQWETDTAALASTRTAVATEYAASPTDEPVLRAGFEREAASRAVSETYQACERADREAASRRTARDEAAAQRDATAADLKLSAWLGRLELLAQAGQSYAMALAALWPTARHWQTVGVQLAALRGQHERATTELHTRQQRREQAEATEAAARQRFETLKETHGETVGAVLEKLHNAGLEVERLKKDQRSNQAQQLQQTTARTQADGERATSERERLDHEAKRASAIADLHQAAEERLLAEADPALHDIEAAGWSVAQAVDLVRHRIDAVLGSGIDGEDAWRKRQDAIHGHIQELRDRLIAHGHQPEPHQRGEIVLVRCVFQGRPHTMTELREAFTTEIGERERLLKAREQEIIENHLLAEAAVELQRLIRAAEAWRVSANEELNARPTSTGVRFRFQWEAETEIRFHEVRPILLRKGELWTPSERAALATFLQAQIAAEQTADETGSWRDHLSRALDYRRWHRFAVERQQDGQWRRLNRATYGTGSGGEKALALTLPRFAAAAAHYRSAAKTAPRLVMLDEAFAGIDPTMRAQCMGVLAQFDLDVVMTSELEWGCYRTVPALAIYHLTTLPGLDAVAATRWIWNGRERRQEDLALPPDAAPTEPTLDAQSGETPGAPENAGKDG